MEGFLNGLLEQFPDEIRITFSESLEKISEELPKNSRRNLWKNPRVTLSSMGIFEKKKPQGARVKDVLEELQNGFPMELLDEFSVSLPEGFSKYLVEFP